MVDFENYRFSSIKYPLQNSPSALVLASTGNVENSFYAGSLAGYYLGQVGVDAILGPVLDLNLNQKQGLMNSTIKDRSFSDRPEVVAAHANAYIRGLKNSNLSVFAKHYPSYSSVDKNPHSGASSYTGSIENLKKELRVFSYLKDELDGVMTSHLNIGVSDNYLPFTFSQEQVEQFFLKNKDGMNFEKILITDDLSDMEAVSQYMLDRGKDYSDIAFEAFMAGHDYLLFSHVGGRSKDVRVDDIERAIDFISEKALSRSDVKARLHNAIFKIINYKNKVDYAEHVADFDFNAAKIFEDSDFDSADKFLRAVFEEGLIGIKMPGSGLPKLGRLSIDHSYLVLTKNKYVESFSEFSSQGENYSVESVPKYSDISTYQKFLVKALQEYDLVYITVENVDDINAVDYVRIYYPKLLDRLVVFLHENPSVIPESLLTKAKYIISNFSQNPLSYQIDAELILNKVGYKGIKSLPISLINRAFHDTQSMPELKSTLPIAKPVLFYRTKNEMLLNDKISVLERKVEFLEGQETYDKFTNEDKLIYITANRVLFFCLLVFGMLFILLGVKPYFKEGEEGNKVDYKKTLHMFFYMFSPFGKIALKKMGFSCAINSIVGLAVLYLSK